MQLPKILLTLRQMCLAKVALQVFNDPDVRLFTTTHSVHYCIWSTEEIESLLGKEPETLLNDEVYQFLFGLVQTTPSQQYKHRITSGDQYHPLPITQWEILLNQTLDALSLPNMFKKEIKGLVRLIVIESLIWVQDHKTTIQCTTYLLNHFHWTQDNKIDRVKTAKSIIADYKIHIRERFMLALLYCFDAYFLWIESGPQFRFHFEIDCYDEMTMPWLLYLRDGKEIDWEKYAREIRCKDFGFRTYLLKMRQKKRPEFVKRLLSQGRINYHELQFCLSTLNQNQQNKVIRRCSFEILKFFLDWPLREKLLDVLELLSPYLSLTNFRNLLDLILCQKRLFHWISYDTYTLVKELWKRNPPWEYNKIINYCTLKLVLEYDGSPLFTDELRGCSNDANLTAFYYGNIVFALCKNYVSDASDDLVCFFSIPCRHNTQFFL